MEYKDFTANLAAYRAVERDFEIIGEAVKKLSPGFKNRYPQIPWQDIAGFRNVLVHEYAAVNAATVWDTLKQDTPKLKAVLQKHFED